MVCAAIDGQGQERDNVAHVVGSASDRQQQRFHVVADLDCPWSEHYHRPGAAERLRALADRYQLAGFTLRYVLQDNDGWLTSDEAEAVFAVAEQRGLLVSLAAGPAWQADLRAIAQRHQWVPVLCHHLAGLATI